MHNELLKFACCNTNDVEFIENMLLKINNFSTINIDDIYFTVCCSGNYEISRFLKENFNVNIRKHNDIEFAYNFSLHYKCKNVNSELIKFVESNVLNCKYLNMNKIKINRKKNDRLVINTII